MTLKTDSDWNVNRKMNENIDQVLKALKLSPWLDRDTVAPTQTTQSTIVERDAISTTTKT